MSRSEAPDAPPAPGGATTPLTARTTPESLPQRLLRHLVHYLTHRFVLTRRKTVESYAAGFRFTVPPTVFHPSVFKTGEYFAEFIGGLDLHGRKVAGRGPRARHFPLAPARARARPGLAPPTNTQGGRGGDAHPRHHR